MLLLEEKSEWWKVGIIDSGHQSNWMPIWMRAGWDLNPAPSGDISRKLPFSVGSNNFGFGVLFEFDTVVCLCMF